MHTGRDAGSPSGRTPAGFRIPLRLKWVIRTVRASWKSHASAIGVLGLGAGAILAAVSVLNGAVVNALPYEKANRLYEVHKVWRPPWAENGETTKVLELNEIHDWLSLTNVLGGVGAYFSSEEVLSLRKLVTPCSCASVSADLLRILGCGVVAGRGFRPDDFRAGSECTALVTRAACERWLGPVPDAVGAVVTLKNRPYRVIGILADHPRFLNEVDVFVPLTLEAGRTGIAQVVVDLGRREALSYAEQRMAELARRTGGETLHKEVRLVRLGAAQLEAVRGAVVAFVLCSATTLILCGLNLALVMVGHALQREHETAVALALGAPRAWVLGQSILEVLVIGLGAIPLGLALACGTVLRIHDFLPGLPWVFQVHLGWKPALAGVAMVIVIATAVGVAIGLWRLTQGRRRLPQLGLAVFGSRRCRNIIEILVAVQMAVGVALGATAFAHARAYATKVRSDLGFDPEGLLSVVVELPESRYRSRESRAAFFRELLGELRTREGVESAGLCGTLPLTGIGGGARLRVDGALAAAAGSDVIQVAFANVSEHYFQTLRIPLKQGRTLNETDAMAMPSVAVVNEAFQRKYGGTNDVVGLRVGSMTIVGVVGDVKGDIEWPVEPQVFGSYLEGDNRIGAVALRVKRKGSARSVAAACRAALERLDSDSGMASIATLDDRLAERLLPFRTGMLVTTAFTAVALVLGAVGVYGVVALRVDERAREFALRIALGATRRNIARLVLFKLMAIMISGVLTGALACIWLRSLLQAAMPTETPLRSIDIAAAATAMVLAALLVCFAPIVSAARSDAWAEIRGSRE